MERKVASILLMLSVEALLVAAGLSAAGSGDTDIIRLPSDGIGKEEMPWKCCNMPRCTKSWPPLCQCLDRVEHCSDACKKCVDVEGSHKACADWYRGQPPRRCHHHVAHGGSMVTGARKKNGVERPWKCCNRPVAGPSTDWPPVWYCMDKFERCDCEHCIKATSGHGYICLDGYKGSNPGPSFTRDG